MWYVLQTLFSCLGLIFGAIGAGEARKRMKEEIKEEIQNEKVKSS